MGNNASYGKHSATARRRLRLFVATTAGSTARLVTNRIKRASIRSQSSRYPISVRLLTNWCRLPRSRFQPQRISSTLFNSRTRLYAVPYPTAKVSLFHKPHIDGTPRRCWPFEFKVEFVDNLRDYLCNFHQTDVLANACPRARPELLFPSASEHLDEAQMIHQVL